MFSRSVHCPAALVLIVTVGTVYSSPQTAQHPPASPQQQAAALAALEQSASKGNSYAAYLAGRAYESGVGLPDDRPQMYRALNLYNQANQAGNLNALYRLGWLMSRGITDSSQPPALRPQRGRQLMQLAITRGYNPATDGAAQGPAFDDDAGSKAATLLFLGLLGIAAVAAGGADGGGDSSTSGFKSCRVPTTVYVPDTAPFVGTHPEVRWVVKYGSACP